jgi:large subunit ribosomal protein L33
MQVSRKKEEPGTKYYATGYNRAVRRFTVSVCVVGAERTVMAKSKKKSETVFLVCEETGDHNYIVRRKPGGEKLKLRKYSPRLRKHTIHNEKKK